MRVLVVTIVHDPRDARIYHREIAALLSAGHEVTYAAPFTAYGVERPASVRTIDVPRARGRRRVRAIRGARRMLRAEARRHDVVLLHDPELLLAARGLRGPLVVWDVHEDTAAAVSLKPWLPRPLRRATAATVRRFERATERRHPLLLAEEGYRGRFAREHPVVPNSTPAPETVLPSGSDRVVYVGSLTRARGVLEMVELGRLLQGSGVELHVVGTADAPSTTALREAEEHGWLRWHGFMPNDQAFQVVDGALAGLSLLHDEANYHSSRPTKVLEYMAHGVPVISTPTHASRVLVEQTGCGVVVPFGEPAEVASAVAAAVADLASDPARRQALADAGRVAALRDHDWRSDGPAFVRTLEEWAMLDRRPATSRVTTLKRRALGRPTVRRARAVRELVRLVRTLRGSVLFERELYELQRGRRFPGRAAAAFDWVVTGSRAGLVAGPLLIPTVDATTRPRGIGAAARWASQAREAGFPRTTAHPLADLPWYAGQHPDAGGWRGGPLAHYTQRGRQQAATRLGPHDPGGVDLVELGRAAVRGEAAPPRVRRGQDAPPRVTAVVLAGTRLHTALDSFPMLLDPASGVDEVVVAGLDPTVPEERLVAAALDVALPPVRSSSVGPAVADVLAASPAEVLLVVTVPVSTDAADLGRLVAAVADGGADVAGPVVLDVDDTVRAAGLRDGTPAYAGQPLADAVRAGERRVDGVTGEVLAVRRSTLETVPGTAGGPAEPVAAWAAWTAAAASAGAEVRVLSASVVGVQEPRPGRTATPAPRPASLYADPTAAPVLRWAIKSPHPAGPRRRTWGDYHFATALAAALEALGHEVAVDPLDSWYRDSAVDDHVTLTLRGLHRYRPAPQQVNLLWVISHPELVGDGELGDFDAAFAASVAWSRERSAHGVPVTPLLQCTDATRFAPDAGTPGSGDPILFVGNSRGVRRPLVEAAAAADRGLAVYGGGWAGRLPEGVLRAGYVDNAQLAALYRSAGVVLNDHWPEMAAAGFLSNRLFDLTAAGARWVSDPAVGLAEVFPTGRVASDGDGLLRLLDGAPGSFPTEEELLEASRRVRAEHSFDARARELSSVVERLVRERGAGAAATGA